MSDDLYGQMKQSVIDGEAEAAAALAQKGLDAGLSAGDILDLGFVKGIEKVGDLFGRGEFFLPELVQGAEAMKAAVRSEEHTSALPSTSGRPAAAPCWTHCSRSRK